MTAFAPVASRPVASGPLPDDGITGVVAVTEADDVVSSAAAVEATATVAVTEADDTTSSAVAVDVSAVADITEADDTASSAVAVDVEATVDVTEADDTASGAVTVDITATVAVTEDDDTTQSTLNVVYHPGAGSKGAITYQEWKLRDRDRKREEARVARERAGDDLAARMAKAGAINAAAIEDEEVYLLLLTG